MSSRSTEQVQRRETAHARASQEECQATGPDEFDCAARCGARPDDPANWLTGEEWNICYFLGQAEYFQDHVRCGLCEQVSVGMTQLAAAGYSFEFLVAQPPGGLTPRAGVEAVGVHQASCRELAHDRFDVIGRARDALRTLAARAPHVDAAWIERLVALYEETHPQPAAA
ncbi:MAG: hypothetical protein HY900_00205 [Deltaproteobacteria bacterium]|nr:hypothetical protein [Deltaproteobacteria bacterium]